MNKIDEFALQSQKEYGDFDGSITAFDYRKFAELIIRECANVCESRSNPEQPIHIVSVAYANAVKNHFGVE